VYPEHVSESNADNRRERRQAAQRWRPLNVAGLFAGIGGFELGLTETGAYSPVLLCDNDPAAEVVLQRRFPGVSFERDIERLTKLPANTDVVTAGFPCQDLSQVGPTLGLNGKHSSLVGHVFKLLRKRQVRWVILENVPFMLHLHRGAALGSVVTSLEQLGYTWAYRVVDTQAFGLPQRRRRVFLVASPTDDPRGVLFSDDADHLASSLTRENEYGTAVGFYWTKATAAWAGPSTPSHH
jgi:DNA (cytosine-5)-methyltransferase 1